MNIIIDTNIFISALIKDGHVRNLIVHSKDALFLPEFELEEIYKNREEIIKKAKLTEKEFLMLVLRLLSYVKIVPNDICIKYETTAFRIMANIDIDDVQFIAAALALNAIVWSDDNHFQKQKEVKVVTTREISSKFMLY